MPWNLWNNEKKTHSVQPRLLSGPPNRNQLSEAVFKTWRFPGPKGLGPKGNFRWIEQWKNEAEQVDSPKMNLWLCGFWWYELWVIHQKYRMVFDESFGGVHEMIWSLNESSTIIESEVSQHKTQTDPWVFCLHARQIMRLTSQLAQCSNTLRWSNMAC